MYADFYGFTQEPFQAEVDRLSFFLRPSLGEILAATEHCIQRRKGLVTITGDAGVGKTMLLAYHKMFVTDDDRKTVYQSLHVLSNFEAPRQKQKLIQLVLFGQPALDALLNRPDLRHMSERIALRACIPPLTKLESVAYIHHRLKVASSRPASVFSKGALNLLVKAGNGIPRRLNTLCDNALTAGFGYQESVVSRQVAKEVIAELKGRRSPFVWNLQPRHAVVMASVVLPMIVYSTI
jgi:type II secretory pathway predicted ATPase ExeA